MITDTRCRIKRINMMHDTGYMIQDKENTPLNPPLPRGNTPLNPPLPRGELKGGIVNRASCIMNRASCILNRAGTTLVELMVTLAIFSIIMGMMYSVYNAFLKAATAERKVAKTEMDVFAVSWPLIKEIQTAGFGIPSTGTCTPAVTGAVASGELVIHSTASGDDSAAGTYAYVTGTTCMLSTTDIPMGSKAVVISSTTKKQLSPAGSPVTVSTSTSSYISTGCEGTLYQNNMVYWIPWTSQAGALECYRTTYTMRDYDPASSKPAMCASGTKKLSRKADASGSADFRPMLDCVRALAYRFGCINDSGNLTWHSDTACTGATGSPVLKLVKVGMVMQSGTRRDSQSPQTINLFEDLGGNWTTVNLTDEQRYYKWRELEYTVTLRNTQ
ncbi:MAG: prepilin-type N-terminal cleavage/methylation domain-containing protein [Nitrospirae bacterium]|nr:prepilin-type N-terminal cleavage/methylation domain-containing protein [Nitrospirota bacterium]